MIADFEARWVLGDNGLEVAGVPASRLAWADLAAAAKDPAKRPEGVAEPPSAMHGLQGQGWRCL